MNISYGIKIFPFGIENVFLTPSRPV